MDEPCHFFGGDVSAVAARGLERPTISSSTTGQILPHICFSANCERDSRANVPRNVEGGGEQGTEQKGVRKGSCRDSSTHFSGRENCMSVYAAEFCGARLYIAASAKTGERFCVAPPTLPSLRLSLANALRSHPEAASPSRYYICIVS